MMHSLLHLSATHWWSVLGWTIWSYFWVGLGEFLLVLPFYLLLRRRSPELHYNVLLLWMALLCVTPLYLFVRISHSLPVNAPAPFITAIRPPELSTLTPRNSIRHESPDSIPNVIPPDQKLDSIPALMVPDQTVSRMPGANPSRQSQAPVKRLPFPQIQILPQASTPADSSMESSVSPWLVALIPWLPVLWLLGAFFSFLLIAFGLVGTERFRRQATLLTSGPLYDRCVQLAARLQIRGKILIGLCDRIATPILLGIWRPLILLPLAAETGWPPDQLDMILLHELAHVRRFDNFVHLLQRLAEGVLFFQPAVWILSRWISLEREHCCDSLVVRATGRPQDYARTLAHLALGEPFPTNLAPSSAFARNHLLTRIRRILNQEQSLQVSRGTLGLAASCLFLALVIAGALNARETVPVVVQAENAPSNPVPESGSEKPSPDKRSKPNDAPFAERSKLEAQLQVVDLANTPLRDVQVDVLNSKGEKIQQTNSDERGWFSIPATRTLGISLKKEGFLPLKIPHALDKFPQDHNFESGQLVKSRSSFMAIEMMGCGTLLAKVIGPDGKPAPHVPVQVENYFSSDDVPRKQKSLISISDAEGIATFRNLREGLLSVSYPATWNQRTLKDLTLQQRADGAAWIKNPHHLPYPDLRWSQTVFHQDRETQNLTIDLSECKSSLSGQIVDSQGKPRSKVWVCCNRLSEPDQKDLDPRAYERLMRKLWTLGIPDARTLLLKGTVSDSQRLFALSDENGRFEFAGLRGGLAKIGAFRVVQESDPHSVLEMPKVGSIERHGFQLSQAEIIRLEPNKAKTAVKISLPDSQLSISKSESPFESDSDFDQKVSRDSTDKPGFKTVTARVVDSKGSPIPNAAVSLDYQEIIQTQTNGPIERRHRTHPSILTDTNGHFTFNAKRDVTYGVSINAKGYVSPGGGLDLSRTENEKPQTFTLLRPAKIIARLKRPDGKPVPDAPFSCFSVSNFGDLRNIQRGTSPSSSQQGTLELNDVWPGEVTLSYSAGGEARVGALRYNIPLRTPSKLPLENVFWGEFLTLQEGETRHLDIDFSICTGRIRGRLVDRHNQPIVGKILDIGYLHPQEPGRKVDSRNLIRYPGGISESEGRFEIFGLRPGTYQIWASEPYSNNRDALSPANAIEVTADRIVECNLQANVSTAPNHKKLSLTLLGPDKKPVPFALLQVTHAKFLKNSFVLTDRNGNAEATVENDSTACVIYPPPWKIPALGLKSQPDLKKIVAGKFPSGFQPDSDYVPVKECIWIRDVSLEKDSNIRHTIDLSTCSASLDLKFEDKDQQSIILKKVDLIRIPDNDWEISPTIKSGMQVPTLNLQTDASGRIRIGKLLPGKYGLKWFGDDKSQFGTEILILEKDQTLTRTVTLNALDSQGSAPATSSQPQSSRVIESRSISLGTDSSPKELHLTILGPDKKPLPHALITTIFKASSEPQRFLGLSNAQGELILKYPSDGIVHIAYPPTVGVRKIDQSESARQKSDEVFRKMIGPQFKTLDEHLSVKNVVYLKSIPLTFAETHATVDLSTCQTSLNLRFVDEHLNPVKPRYLRIGAVIGPDTRSAEEFSRDRDALFPIGTEVDDNGNLSIGKLNPGTYRITWAGNRYFGGPQSAIIEVPQSSTNLDLVVKTRESPQVEVYPADRTSSNPVTQPLSGKITILGLDGKPLPGALVRLAHSSKGYFYPDFALSDLKGSLDVNSSLVQEKTVIYPLDAAIPASDQHDDPSRRATVETTLRTRFSDRYKGLETHVPVKNVLWMGQWTTANRLTVDLSQCTSQVELIFIDDQDRPVVPRSVELLRVPGRATSKDPNGLSPNPYFLTLKSDSSGHLSLGKMNPGKFQVRWTTNPDRAWLDEFTVEPHTDIKRKFVIPAQGKPEPAVSTQKQN